MCAENYDDRLAVFEKMAQADPTNELAHFSLGRIRHERGEHEAAVASLSRVLELVAHHAQAHRLLGASLLALGRRQEAIDVLAAGVRAAHERGEFLPRNQMQEMLRQAGVEPPDLAGAAGPQGGEAETGAFRCRRCLEPNQPLEMAPFRSEIGRRIQATICQRCWREWMAMSIKVINEYRLNLATPEGNQVFEAHMKEFLGL
jgi:Fe-S cluster biosynthesis and repair protein YggX